MHFGFYAWLFLQWNIATMRATMKYCSSLPIRLWKTVEHLPWLAHPTVIKLRYEFWSVGHVGPDSTHEQNHCTEVVNKHLHCPAEGTTKTQQCTVVDMLEFLTEVSLRQALSEFVFQGLLIPSQFSKAVVSSFVALSVAQMFETFACKRAEHISQQNLLQKILKLRNFSDIEFPVILEALQLFWETDWTNFP